MISTEWRVREQDVVFWSLDGREGGVGMGVARKRHEEEEEEEEGRKRQYRGECIVNK